MSQYQDPNFDKATYWDRRRKGYAGQVPSPGTKPFFKQQRRLARQLQRAETEAMKGGKDERKKLKSLKKSI